MNREIKLTNEAADELVKCVLIDDLTHFLDTIRANEHPEDVSSSIDYMEATLRILSYYMARSEFELFFKKHPEYRGYLPADLGPGE